VGPDQLRAVFAGVVLVGGLAVVSLVKLSPRAPEEPVATPRPRDPNAAPASDSGAPGRRWDTEEIPTWKVGVPMRPMDRDIVAALVAGHVDRSRVIDLFPERAYQVRLAGSAETGAFPYLLVDLNRDGTWDERWDLTKPGEIRRTVTHDPDAYGREVTYTLAHGRWQPH